MSKRILGLLAILGLMILPLLAQNTTFVGGNGGGNGNGGNGSNGGNGGNGGNVGCSPIYNLLTGSPFSFSGTVISAGIYGDGLVLTTSTGNITVWGLGANNYWNSLNMTKPVEGDIVSGNGYTLDYNGDIRNVLTQITVNGTLVPLRDENGLPLWRHIGREWENMPGAGGFNGICYDILNGTPFTYSGEIISNSVNNYGIQGNGMVLATTAGNISVLGLGPIYYWDNLNITHPVVGDTIIANGFTVDYNSNIVNILMSVVLEDGTTIQLRDTATGAPLWRNQGNN